MLVISINKVYGQNHKIPTKSSKGDFYFYYGWNQSSYSLSDIHFEGEGYNFTLFDVKALDRPSHYRFNLYFNPRTFTVPQYNFRIGYFLSNCLSISIGVDHMKYVVTNGQYVNITGSTKDINSTETHYYSNETIIISEDLLQYEHTDGLNYINMDIRFNKTLFSIGHLSVITNYGGGFGFLLPKTNAKILGRARHDDFHLSGLGVNLLGALNIQFYNHFFVQTEVKGGYINMPFIRTTNDTSDQASQSFWFSQLALVFGAKF